MYCGSCLHDNALAAALIALGDDVLLVPTYTPLRTDEADVSQPRLFLGGINVALQQRLGIFRHTPWWLDRLLDHPALVGWLARHASVTDPRQLGELTLSVLRGPEGRQKKECDKLVHWLEREPAADVIHLSNTLLAGLARPLRERLSVPIVCTLSGEDSFVEKLRPPWYERVRVELRRRCRDVDGFIALNRYYADFMARYLEVPAARIGVIPHGLALDGYGDRWAGRSAGEPFTIGALARICPDKGLHLLADAFIRLCRRPQMPRLRLRLAGYLGRAERPYLAQMENRLHQAGLADQYEYVGEVDRRGKGAFLESLDLFCLPTIYPESKGLPALEALASGVAVVLPRHGSFPELIDQTGGGLLFRPGDLGELATALERMVRDPGEARRCGQRGRAAVFAQFGAAQMAERTRAYYKQTPIPHFRGCEPGRLT